MKTFIGHSQQQLTNIWMGLRSVWLVCKKGGEDVEGGNRWMHLCINMPFKHNGIYTYVFGRRFIDLFADTYRIAVKQWVLVE